MSWLSRSRRFAWLLVAAQLALLALLATLQYRWTEQVSRALEQRMRSALAVGAERFGEDFDRELTRAFLHFWPEDAARVDDLGPVYAGLLSSWRETAPAPALVREIYRVRGADGGLDLALLATEEERFVAADWPPGLEDLRRRLEGRPDPARWVGQRRPLRFFLAPEIPALVIPLVDPPAVRGPRRRDLRSAARGWMVLELDLDFIRDDFLPRLTERHFARDEQLDFEVEVLAADTRAPVYRSDPRAPELSFGSDLEIGIFGFLHDEELRRLFFDARLAGAFGGPGGRGPRGLGMLRPGPGPWPPGRPEPGDEPVLSERGAWRLLVRHREGSLEAAVGRFRRRNLALGFGVLGLLAATASMLLISGRRAQKLAAQQVEFVAGITHELRTPIAAVRSLGQNLADGVAADPQQVRRYGALIERQGSRLSRLVEQVLELSGFLSSRKSLALERCEVGAIVEASVADCRPLAEEKSARIEVEIAAGLPAVAADAEALARAVANLIANAVKHGGGEPWVGVRARPPAVPGGEVTIEVADRGPGIPRDELPRIFEPFYRGRDAAAGQTEGAGLGLSLVRRIAEAHGGRAEARSGPGGGSVFSLRLPALRGDDGG